MTEMEWMLGMQLDEYRLEKRLGQGGMASVYLALDVYLKRYAAIKTIAAPYAEEKDYLVRFEREARAIAQIEHPHVVRLYRYGESNGVLYIAMQYIEGVDLEDLLKGYRQSKEYMDPQDVLLMVQQIGSALDYVHSKGIIHRDVKSANIMLDKNGSAFLTDFGLALTISVGTRGEVFGSPHYLSPEQAVSSAKAVPQSDIYSMGVILYEIFTGTLPFDAKDPLDIAMLHLTQPPRPPSEIRPDISPALEAVILKALAKKPEDRFASGEELAQALEAALKPSMKHADVVDESSLYKETVPDRPAIELDEIPLPPPPAVVQDQPVLEPQERIEPVPPAIQAVPVASRTAQEELFIPAPPAPEIPGSQPQASAPARRPKRMAPILLGVIGLCVLVTCAVAGAVGLTQAMNSLKKATSSPNATGSPAASGILTTKKTATNSATASRTATAKATTLPTLTSTPAANYQLTIVKCEDYRCLAIVNDGNVDFPLNSLRLVGEEDSTPGSIWGLDVLPAGSCVTISVKKDNRLPAGVNCSLTGPVLTMGQKNLIGKETLDIFFGEKKLSTCIKSLTTCPVVIPIP